MPPLSPYYNRGATIDLGDQAFQVEAILREGKGVMQALKVRKVTKKTKTKIMVDEERAFVLKIFRTEGQSAVANRAFENWKKLREVLRPSGFPEMHHCDNRVVVTEFIEGTVAERIEKLNSKIISKIVLDITGQIDVLLQHEMAHGDVKPANIVRKIGDQGAPRSRLIDMDYLAPLGIYESVTLHCVSERRISCRLNTLREDICAEQTCTLSEKRAASGRACISN